MPYKIDFFSQQQRKHMTQFEFLDNLDDKNINEFANYGSKLFLETSDIGTFYDNEGNVAKPSTTKVFVNHSERCEFKFARQTLVDGNIVEKGQRCCKARIKGKKFCETHQYAALRRKWKAEESALIMSDVADEQEASTNTSLLEQITSIQNQLESIKKRLIDSQQIKI